MLWVVVMLVEGGNDGGVMLVVGSVNDGRSGSVTSYAFPQHTPHHSNTLPASITLHYVTRLHLVGKWQRKISFIFMKDFPETL